jgi:hypothetical protein
MTECTEYNRKPVSQMKLDVWNDLLHRLEVP